MSSKNFKKTRTQREFPSVIRRQEEEHRGEEGEHDSRTHEHILIVRAPALQTEGERQVRVGLFTARVVLLVPLCWMRRQFPDVTL